MESILTLCEARGLQGRRLRWHYRSKDPSLIEVSNREFYDDDLVLPPSPFQRDPSYGLALSRVGGVYDRGGKRDNRIEGEAVVDRVAEHARDWADRSLGIVTFSFAQRNLITDLLEFRRRTDAVLDEFLREGKYEDAFVKNIENVQGDERDVILVSVGYGPSNPGGRLNSMSFGPVNAEGGERRLNVLFTRARYRCEIFASFDPSDIDLSRAPGVGPRVFKRFLDFAKTGRIDEVVITGGLADSPFEEDVAKVITGMGYLCDLQIGSVGFRIDMGVRHPERPGEYILAIECDGATYHGSLWARERDRLRQDVLENLGWKFHRIWSTDWFYCRAQEINRLRSALEVATQTSGNDVPTQGANGGGSTTPDVAFVAPDAADLVKPEVLVRQMPPYQRAIFPVRSQIEPHEVAVSSLSELAIRIVRAEGPIHTEEVARRIASSYGKDRAGSRIVGATRAALLLAQRMHAGMRAEEGFWYTDEQALNPPVRDRSAESGPTLKAEHISLLEIRAAFTIARTDNGGGLDEDLVRAVARLLGFRRVGPELRERLGFGLT